MVDDPITLYQRAADEFGAQTAAVGPADWDRPTPCTDWDVRLLVRHVVEEDLWARGLFAGQSLDAAGAALPGDALGADPAAAYAGAAAEALEVARREADAVPVVHLSVGDTPAVEYARQLTADHLIHAWDLATALGRPFDPAADLVAAVGEWFGGVEAAYRAAGAIGPRPDVAPDADAFTRLLAAFGRSR
jgi:uncharacterized protein (TIGR03086 family)